MNALWDPQQREWLQALGHDVLMLAGAATASDNAGAAVQSRSVAPARELVPSARTEAALLRAVLRAAGRRDIAELAAWLPDPATLRGNAAAKRALWPRLRTLRRKPDGP